MQISFNPATSFKGQWTFGADDNDRYFIREELKKLDPWVEDEDVEKTMKQGDKLATEISKNTPPGCDGIIGLYATQITFPGDISRAHLFADRIIADGRKITLSNLDDLEYRRYKGPLISQSALDTLKNQVIQKSKPSAGGDGKNFNALI